jgi:hypothetical protein
MKRFYKSQKKKPRNWLAVHAHFKSGAGVHQNKKKENSRRVCREKVRYHT